MLILDVRYLNTMYTLKRMLEIPFTFIFSFPLTYFTFLIFNFKWSQHACLFVKSASCDRSGGGFVKNEEVYDQKGAKELEATVSLLELRIL